MSRESMETARGVVQAFLDADWDRFAQLFTPDSVYDEVGSGRRAEGRDEIASIFQGWNRAWPDCQGVITNEIDAGDTAVLEIAWKGTNTGPLATPQGEIAPTGKNMTVRTCFVCTFDADTIKESSHYFDLLALMGQLGLLPEASAA